MIKGKQEDAPRIWTSIIHCCYSLSLGGLQACPKLGPRTCSSLVGLTLGGEQRQGCGLAKMLSTSLMLSLHVIAEFHFWDQEPDFTLY